MASSPNRPPPNGAHPAAELADLNTDAPVDAIRMCDSCRLVAAVNDSLDPYPARARAKPRTTEDHLRERAPAAIRNRAAEFLFAKEVPAAIASGTVRGRDMASMQVHKMLLWRLRQPR
jgi:hypothetical protein